CHFGQRGSDQGLPRREVSVPGRHNHCCFALASLPVGGKQQSLWPCPVFRGRVPYERSVYGQGLKEIRCHGRLEVRSFQRARRQTCRSGVYENLLCLPPGCQSPRPCLHQILPLIRRTATPWHRQTPSQPQKGMASLVSRLTSWSPR